MNPWRIPIAGLAWLLPRPRQWAQAALAHLLALLVLLITGGLVIWWGWPDPLDTWWAKFHALGAIGLGLGAAVLAWALVLPVLLALVLDTVAEAALRGRGVTVVPVPALDSVLGTLAILMRTLPRRLSWSVVALLSPLVGPLGIFVAAYAMARIANADALDTVLALQGKSVSQRLAYVREHRTAIRKSSVSAAGLQIALAITLIGWLLWMPALVAGYGLAVESEKT